MPSLRLLLPSVIAAAAAAADPLLPPGLQPLPPAGDGGARAALPFGAATYALRRTAMPGGWTAWIGEAPVDAAFAAAAGLPAAGAGAAALDHQRQDELLRVLAIRHPDLQIRRTRWEWRGLVAGAGAAEFTDTHTGDLADAARGERLGRGWLLAGAPPPPGDEVAVDGGVAARTGPELANALRLWLPDCGAPAATGAEARGRAGFRLAPAAEAPGGPGASPDGRFHAEIVRAGMERAILWIHDGATGALLHHRRVPAMHGAWEDARTVRIDGDGGAMRVDAASGAVLAVVPAPSAADQPDGVVGHDPERIYGGGPLASVRDARLLPGGRQALLFSPDFGLGLVELGTGRLAWTAPAGEMAVGTNGSGFALALSADGRWTVERDATLRGFALRRLTDGAVAGRIWPADQGLPRARRWGFAADGSAVTASGDDGATATWSVPEGRLLRTTPAPAAEPEAAILAGEWPEVTSDDAAADACAAADGLLVGACGDGLLRLWDAADRRLVRVLGAAPIGAAVGMRALPGGLLLTRHARGWATWDVRRGLLAWVDEGWQQSEDPDDLGIITRHRGGELVIGGDAAGLWAVDAERRLVYTPGSGNPWELLARRLPGLEPVWSWAATAQGAPIAMLPDGSWFAERDAAWNLAVALGGERVPLASFDLALNRPDAVLAALGLASGDEVAAWRALAERRLARSRVKPVRPAALDGLPRVRLEAPAEAAGTAAIVVHAAGGRPLRRLLVEVDGVPWPDARGLPVPGEAAAHAARIAVPLAAGINRIEVAAEDVDGNEGVRAMARIAAPPAAAEPTLHVLAIGVGEYPGADPSWRLAYPAKDARDLVAALRRSSNRRVEAQVLADAEATPAGIAAARARLLAGGPDDIAVLFLAGHGALDAQGEYRFFASGGDPARPETGVPWSAIEALLDGIPARDRLALIDTCASGDDAGSPPTAAVPGVRHRGLRAARGAAARLPVSAVFLDPRRGAGAQVVAASGAEEWSYESGDLANGLFTAAILRGLGEGLPADRDRDLRLTAGELAAWTVAEVGRLSGGAQRPRLRSANPGRGVALAVPAASPVADDDGERRSRRAWEARDRQAAGLYHLAAAQDRDPAADRAALAAAWAGIARLLADDGPGDADDRLRDLVAERIAGRPWPTEAEDGGGAPAVARPAWADAIGSDRAGTWADARIDGVRLRFRWCPPGPPPAFGWLGRPVAAAAALPGAWVAATHLTAAQAAALGAALRQRPPPHAAIACTAAEARRLLAALSARLRTTVGTPSAPMWARIWAAGGERVPEPGPFAHESLWPLRAGAAATGEARACGIWPPTPWGVHDTWVEQEWVDGGTGPATDATDGDFARDYPDVLCRRDQSERIVAHAVLPFRPVIPVP